MMKEIAFTEKEDIGNISEEEMSLRVTRLLSLIKSTNAQIDSCSRRKDNFGVKQYKHLKSKFVLELIELLSTYQLTIQIKEAEFKEAA